MALTEPQAGRSLADLGKLCTAQYWLCTELPRVSPLVALCQSGEDSYAQMQTDWFWRALSAGGFA